MTTSQIRTIFSTDLNYSLNTLFEPKEIRAIGLDNDGVIIVNKSIKFKFVNNWNILEVYRADQNGNFRDKPNDYITVSDIFTVMLY